MKFKKIMRQYPSSEILHVFDGSLAYRNICYNNLSANVHENSMFAQLDKTVTKKAVFFYNFKFAAIILEI